MFIRLLSACTIRSFGESLVFNSKLFIKFVSLKIQPYQTRPIVININFDETLFNPFTVSVNKCGGMCNAIIDPYARIWVSKVKIMNVKVFDLMSRINKTRVLIQHESRECKY